MAGSEKRHRVSAWRCVDCIEITEVVRTTDRCVVARAKETGKLINLPRNITQFSPGRAIVPDWFARRVKEEGRAGQGGSRDDRWCVNQTEGAET